MTELQFFYDGTYYQVEDLKKVIRHWKKEGTSERFIEGIKEEIETAKTYITFLKRGVLKGVDHDGKEAPVNEVIKEYEKAIKMNKDFLKALQKMI